MLIWKRLKHSFIMFNLILYNFGNLALSQNFITKIVVK